MYLTNNLRKAITLQTDSYHNLHGPLANDLHKLLDTQSIIIDVSLCNESLKNCWLEFFKTKLQRSICLYAPASNISTKTPWPYVLKQLE